MRRGKMPALQYFHVFPLYNLAAHQLTTRKILGKRRYHEVVAKGIAKYLHIHYKVTTQEILTDVLRFEINQCDQLKQRRVINILQHLGCESKIVSRNGKKFRAWVYAPPSPEGNRGTSIIRTQNRVKLKSLILLVEG
jgi:hypothetical protein